MPTLITVFVTENAYKGGGGMFLKKDKAEHCVCKYCIRLTYLFAHASFEGFEFSKLVIKDTRICIINEEKNIYRST